MVHHGPQLVEIAEVAQLGRMCMTSGEHGNTEEDHTREHGQRSHGGAARPGAGIPGPFLALAPVVPRAARKDIFRVRESRYELAVAPVGLPPSVIEMEMSAEHEVDGLRFHARCAKLLEIGN